MKKSTAFRQPERLRTDFTREGGYYVLVVAFVLTGAMLRDINLMMLIAGVMVGLWVYNWRKASSMLRKLELRRSAPETICAGDTLVVDVDVVNLARRKVKRGLVVHDTIRRLGGKKAREAASAEVVFERVASAAQGGRQSRSYQGRIWTRGRYELGPLGVSCRFPFGLMRRRGSVEDRRELVVYPRLGRLTPAWSRLHRQALVGSQRIRRQQTQSEGDFYGLRDWREGDSQRWIHWRTSARRDKLVVRQYERQRRQDVVLLLDLFQGPQPTMEAADAVELAVSFAATIAADLCRRGGSHVRLVVGGRERAAVQGVASQALLTEIMAALAVAQPAPEDVLPELVAHGLQVVPRHLQLVFISTRKVDVATLAMSENLPESTSHLLTQMRSICVDCSSREIDEYFTLS
jgi:uncharacterized protein (DUF58 family)